MVQPAHRFEVPFGTGSISFELPEGVVGDVARSRHVDTLADPIRAANEAIERPIGTVHLRELATGKRTACIAVTDATRNCPDHLLVPPMLRELEAAGIPDDGITILVAVGTHRASTQAEKRAKLGDAIVERYRVVDHDAADPNGLVKVADGPGGVPFLLNKTAMEAEILLATGRVEPHQYAGFSGGGKTIAIGCASDPIIAYTHGPAMLDLPGTRLARLAGNPFQEAVREVARAAKLAFVANLVMDDDDNIVAIAYGAPEAVQDRLAGIALDIYTVPIPNQVDIAVAGVGYPKDVNLYQASRAASYLQYGPVPVVRKGGVIILPAACPEGAGEGAGEQRFLEAMQEPNGVSAIIANARANGIRPGEQRAYIMANVLSDVTVIVAGVEREAEARAVGFVPAADIDEALSMAVEIVGTPASALIVPHALLTLPIVGQFSYTT
ncbi:MAG: nickel-dependent lactate racemase [Thermomicrobiales bacterium]|nr:nickel-dependent lactate racemase [Thermomicrobiales bacterium]